MTGNPDAPYPCDVVFVADVILLIGIIWLHARVGEKGRDIARLQEQVAYLAGRLPAGEDAVQASASGESIRSLIGDLGTNNLVTQYQGDCSSRGSASPRCRIWWRR